MKKILVYFFTIFFPLIVLSQNPTNFLWGVAQSAFQTEMNNNSATIVKNTDWYQWTHDQNIIDKNFVSGDKPEENGPGFWVNYKRDIDLAKSLGVNAMRISISWARIFPDPTFDITVPVERDELTTLDNKYTVYLTKKIDIDASTLDQLDRIANKSALNHYREILEYMRKNGITPMVTLYHWPLPLWLHDYNLVRDHYLEIKHTDNVGNNASGWISNQTVVEFAKYAAYLAWKLGDLVDYWVTINEPQSVIPGGYLIPSEININEIDPHHIINDFVNKYIKITEAFPPGIFSPFYAKIVTYRLINAHALSYNFIKKYDKNSKIGISLVFSAIRDISDYCPEFARDADYILNDYWLNAINGKIDVNFDGSFIYKPYLKTTDCWVGVNYYKKSRVAEIPDTIRSSLELPIKMDFAPLPEVNLGGNKSDLGWEIYPEGLMEMFKKIKDFLPDNDIIVTENGIADQNDIKRARYIDQHLCQIYKARKKGYKIKGYFHWALYDNFEWAKGWAPKFGLCEKEFDATGLRKKRSSADHYKLRITHDGEPVILLIPSVNNPVYVGSFKHPFSFTLKILTFCKEYSSLSKNNFEVRIGNKLAKLKSPIKNSNGYGIDIIPPDASSGINQNGFYDLYIKVTPQDKSLTWEHTEKSCVLYSENVNADVMLVIDRSGSMGGSGYMEPAKSAASQFVSHMSSGDRVGVVSFSSGATLNYGLTEIDNQGKQKKEAQQAISNIYSNGSTSIGSGLLLAQGELDQKGSEQDAWAIVLLSDGFENTAPYVAEVLPQIPDKTNIYTIALGPNSDQGLLQSIANQTGGRFFMSPGANQLLGIYNMILGQVYGGQTLYSYSGQISQGEEDSRDVVVDNTVDECIFSLGWNGSDLSLVLTDPDGEMIDSLKAKYSSDIEHVKGKTYEYYVITSPRSGHWTMTIKGIETNGEEPYTVSVNAETDLRSDIHFYKETYYSGQPILVLSDVFESDRPIVSAEVKAIVIPPGETLESWQDVNGDKMPHRRGFLRKAAAIDTLTLYDDGRHNDGIANDGIYGNYFLNTGKSGSYIFRIESRGKTAQGEPFSRLSEKSCFVESSNGYGQISGKVMYTGKKSGEIYVRLWANKLEREGAPDYMVQVSDSTYVIRDLPIGEYLMDVYMDKNGNGGLDWSEPYGKIDSLLILKDRMYYSGIDLTLRIRKKKITAYAYPNPLNPRLNSCKIRYRLPEDGKVKIEIYDVSMERVRVITDGEFSRGMKDYTVEWNGCNDRGEMVGNGVYYYVITTKKGQKAIGKIAVIK